MPEFATPASIVIIDLCCATKSVARRILLDHNVENRSPRDCDGNGQPGCVATQTNPDERDASMKHNWTSPKVQYFQAVAWRPSTEDEPRLQPQFRFAIST